MSKVESSSIASSSLPATPSTVPKHIDTDVLAPPSTNGDFSRAGSVSAVQTPVVSSVTENASNGSVLGSGIGLDVGSILAESRKRSRAKGRDEEEVEIIAQTAARIATNIVADHIAVLHPDVETPFQDATDVIQRLLPYHVFQQPKEDLQSLTNSGKGKRKATEEELLREEIQETEFALECWKRRRALENRFKKARISSGKRTCHDGQLYVLTQSILEADRSETAYLTAELKAARQELEKIEREKRAAAPPRPQFYAPQPPPSTPTYSTPYRGYTYSYGQGYSTQYTYSPYVPPGTTPATYPATYPTTPSTTIRTSVSTPMGSVSITPSQSTPPTPASSSPTTVTVKPPTVSTSATQASPHIPQPQPPPPPQTAVMAPIPVQLPSSSLAALSALGIIPVPAANAPPPGQPQPAAVLKGTTQNGTTICLEINVSSLQANQMNGLAIILSALTSRGMNVDGSASSSSSGAVSGNPGPVGSSGSGAPSARVGVSSSYQS